MNFRFLIQPLKTGLHKNLTDKLTIKGKKSQNKIKEKEKKISYTLNVMFTQVKGRCLNLKKNFTYVQMRLK